MWGRVIENTTSELHELQDGGKQEGYGEGREQVDRTPPPLPLVRNPITRPLVEKNFPSELDELQDGGEQEGYGQGREQVDRG